MNGLGMARWRRCKNFKGPRMPCEYWCLRPGTHPYPLCLFDNTMLTRERYDNENGDCGAKRWDGMVPVDMEAEAAAATAAKEAAAKADAAAISVMLKTLSEALEVEIPNTPPVRDVISAVVMSDKKPLISQDVYIELAAIAKAEEAASK